MHKYLGVPKDAFQDNTRGIRGITNTFVEHIGLKAKKAESAQEMCTGHIMIVNQVATYSLLNVDFKLEMCEKLDKDMISSYHLKM